MAVLTYAQVKSAIADRLNRDDLTTVIADFAADRIEYYQKECFYAGRVLNGSISTVVGTKNYSFPTGWEQVVTIRILNGSTWIELIQKSYDELQEMDSLQPSVQSLPAYWAPFADQFYVFPAPNAIYSLELTMDLPPNPPADAASNFWTGDAQTLVIEGTCAEICATYLNDPVREARHRPLEERELISLSSKTIRARGGIRTRPYL